MQNLDGREALALARTRKQDNDIQRGKRQQEFIKAIANKSITSIGSYGSLIDAVGSNMKTDMTFEEMKSFFSYLLGGMPQIETLTLQGVDGEIPSTGAYIYVLDQQNLLETQMILKDHRGLIEGTSNISGTLESNESASSEVSLNNNKDTLLLIFDRNRNRLMLEAM